MNKELGKIESVKFGMGGYQDAMFGFTFNFKTKCGGVGDFWGSWSEHYTGCKWTVKERDESLMKHMMRVKAIMEEAGVDDFAKLKGKPVELEFDGDRLITWRILSEVL